MAAGPQTSIFIKYLTPIKWLILHLYFNDCKIILTGNLFDSKMCFIKVSIMDTIQEHIGIDSSWGVKLGGQK